MKYAKEWAQIFRNIMAEQAEVDDSKYTDEEILQMTKGLVAPQICQAQNIQSQWMFELYWISWMMMPPDQATMKSININLFKNRAEDNTN